MMIHTTTTPNRGKAGAVILPSTHWELFAGLTHQSTSNTVCAHTSATHQKHTKIVDFAGAHLQQKATSCFTLTDKGKRRTQSSENAWGILVAGRNQRMCQPTEFAIFLIISIFCSTQLCGKQPEQMHQHTNDTLAQKMNKCQATKQQREKIDGCVKA